MVTTSIIPFFSDAWSKWKDILYNIRDQMWNQFRTQCAWLPCYDNEINIIFKKKARKWISDMLCEARTNHKKPNWLREDVWLKFLEKWNSPEFKRKSVRAKTSRASERGGSLHSGDSMSDARGRLEKLKRGDVSHDEVFEETHKKKKKNDIMEGWIESRVEETHKGLDQCQTQPASKYDASTSQSHKEMKAMQNQIAELTQRWKTLDANITKARKSIKKHMPEYNLEEETESNEE